MFSDNFTVIALPYRPMGNQADYIKTLPAVCMFKYNHETGPACLDCTDAETVNAAPVKQSRKAKKTDKPAETVQEETKPEPAAAPAGKEFSNYETGRAASDFVEPGTDQNAAKLYKIGSVELPADRLETIISNHEYIVSYRTVYAVKRTARGYTGVKIFHSDEYVPIIGRGCFTVMSFDRLKRMFPCTFPDPYYTVLLTIKPADTPEPAAMVQDESIEPEDRTGSPAGPETDHAAGIPEAEGTGTRPADAFRTEAGPEAETPVIIETIQAETGTPESVTIQPAGIEKPVSHEEKQADAEIGAKSPKYRTFQLETVNNPCKAENTAGTAGNEPKTADSRIYLDTETIIPVKPAGSMYPTIMPAGVFRKYGHKSGTPPG